MRMSGSFLPDAAGYGKRVQQEHGHDDVWAQPQGCVIKKRRKE